MARSTAEFAGRRWLAIRALVGIWLLFGALSLHTAFADNTQTITFDNAVDETVGEPLEGQFPHGLIDWGTGTWYLSPPWQRLDNNSISFNGDGISSGSFTFLSPHQLVRIDAYNGYDQPATVTLSCSGQPDKQVQLNADEVRTIDTGWSAPCSQVSIVTSNGWGTNFENLVIQ
jgi:hypothetical protein